MGICNGASDFHQPTINGPTSLQTNKTNKTYVRQSEGTRQPPTIVD